MSVDFENQLRKFYNDDDRAKAALAELIAEASRTWRELYGDLPKNSSEVVSIILNDLETPDPLDSIDPTKFKDYFKDATLENLAKLINDALGQYLPDSCRLDYLCPKNYKPRTERIAGLYRVFPLWDDLVEAIPSQLRRVIIQPLHAITKAERPDLQYLGDLRNTAYDESIKIRTLGGKSWNYLKESFKVSPQ